MMNANDVAALLATVTVAQVMSVYSGKAGKCYCGCSGIHRYARAHREIGGINRGYAVSDDECNNAQVKKVFNIVKANFAYDHETCREGNQPFSIQDQPSPDGKGFVTHFSVELGDRSYTIYLLPK